MERCESCGEEVPSVWRLHVRSEEMTHRTKKAVCAECHPYLWIAPGHDAAGPTAVTDGGTR